MTLTNSALLVGELNPVSHVKYLSFSIIVHAVYSSPRAEVPFGSNSDASTKPSFARVSNRSTWEEL